MTCDDQYNIYTNNGINGFIFQEHISVFVLNGYEDLDTFREMEEGELDYLGITDLEQRSNIMTAIELLQDYTCRNYI